MVNYNTNESSEPSGAEPYSGIGGPARQGSNIMGRVGQISPREEAESLHDAVDPRAVVRPSMMRERSRSQNSEGLHAVLETTSSHVKRQIVNESNNNYNPELDSDSLVSMYKEVKEQNVLDVMLGNVSEALGNISGTSDLSNISSISSTGSSKIPTAKTNTTSKIAKAKTGVNSLTRPTLASNAKSKLHGQSGPAKKSAKPGVYGVPKSKSQKSGGNARPVAGKSSYGYSSSSSYKQPPKTGPAANIYSAANAAKENIMKMLKSIPSEEYYVPSHDYDVNTYIQDISDIQDFSPTRDGANNNVVSSDSDSDHSHNVHNTAEPTEVHGGQESHSATTNDSHSYDGTHSDNFNNNNSLTVSQTGASAGDLASDFTSDMSNMGSRQSSMGTGLGHEESGEKSPRGRSKDRSIGAITPVEELLTSPPRSDTVMENRNYR